ncbi:uncharacterized protein LOC122057168 [Macadamia integrifolia]|uniref:uncharacterized protein LOC122057168 n=1 Tax=Macadamia integrifolia TaxID=60698 RepID=UPI001C52A9B7|nr:uncharacterized protein LOC122057168 [Macadamia integrifolia]
MRRARSILTQAPLQSNQQRLYLLLDYHCPKRPTLLRSQSSFHSELAGRSSWNITLANEPRRTGRSVIAVLQNQRINVFPFLFQLKRTMSLMLGFHLHHVVWFASQFHHHHLKSSSAQGPGSPLPLPLTLTVHNNFQEKHVLAVNSQRTNSSRDYLPRAASLSGSGAEYSEQLLGTEMERQRWRVAGIDQNELLDAPDLVDPDSCFLEFKGVQIHHKICEAPDPTEHSLQEQATSQLNYQNKRIAFPIILLHGFAASVFSWERVMKPLASLTRSKVLAFDRPAFGLTSRVSYSERPNTGGHDMQLLNPYSMTFSVLATLSFIDLLAADKAILMGHSAGSLVAVNTYFEAPEHIAALILVAPAILAPNILPKFSKGSQMKRENQIDGGNSNFYDGNNPLIRIGKTLSKFWIFIVQGIMQMLKGMVGMIGSLYKKALTAILRSALAVTLVRMVIDKFGIAAIRNAWYDANQITTHVLNGYTKPLQVKGWDRALVEYTIAMLTDSASVSKPPLTERLNEISCPVLIVTGDSDRLVPTWNAKRLSEAIPGSCLEVINNCGHLPHEERVEEFVSIVEKFLRRVFGAPEEKFLQAAI